MVDLVIVGGGPAGLTAGIYGARAGIKTLILEKISPGGQVITTDIVENYPGFTEPISGIELIDKMVEQATKFGVEIQNTEVTGIELSENQDLKIIHTTSGDISAIGVIIATGAYHKHLGVPGEDRFWGRGVSCCATCDGMFYRGKKVVVVGGGDTAIKEALFLTKFASEITIVHRRDRLRATKVLQDRIFSMSDKVKFEWKSIVKEIIGENSVNAVKLGYVDSDEEKILNCDGVFIFVGFTPSTDFVRGFVEMDERGYIITDENMRTSVPGVFACGDARKKLLRQIITACGEGATAAFSAEQYIENIKGSAYE
ncbi:TPA: thioredoxin-disulfide reductase [Candidatus Poribacteria bacterium]|nr:thioredoxin-disulfide reductase [Candidatus Poribacteria bacterium]